MCLQVAVEGGHGPEGVFWVPEPQALVLGSHPQALLKCGLKSQVLKAAALALLSEFPLLSMDLRGRHFGALSLSFSFVKW